MDDNWIREFVSGDYQAPRSGQAKSSPYRPTDERRKARKGGWITQVPNGTLTAEGSKALSMPKGCPVRVMLHDAGEWSGMDQPGEALVAFSSGDHGEWVKRSHVRTFSMDESRGTSGGCR